MQYVHTIRCKISFASVAHPWSNGQAERANAEVLRGLKTRTFDTLQKHGRQWIDELSVVLWSLRTTPNRATGHTPFSLVYRAEAVIPTELIYGSPRVLAYDEVAEDQHRHDDAMLLEENRFWAARLLHATSKPRVAIIATGFMPGVFRKAALSLGAFSPPRVQTS